MKLREFLQKHGFSRRQITADIDAAKIYVNKKIVVSYKQELNLNDIVEYGKQKWIFEGNIEKKSEFIILNKPIGYVCSKSDPFNKTIYQLLPQKYLKYYYVGRLDKDSRGLVLLTNDAKMVNKYEHPRYGIEKEYLLVLNREFRRSDLKTCLTGIIDKGDMLKVVNIKVLSEKDLEAYQRFLGKVRIGTAVKLVLNEGKKRHIRRMMRSLRYEVVDLVRICEGEFELGDLKEGEFEIL